MRIENVKYMYVKSDSLTCWSVLTRPSLDHISLIASVNRMTRWLRPGLVNGCYEDRCRFMGRWSARRRIRKVRVETFVSCTLWQNLRIDDDLFELRTAACTSLHVSCTMNTRNVMRHLRTKVWIATSKRRQFRATVALCITYRWACILCPLLLVTQASRVILSTRNANGWRKWTVVIVLALRRWKHIVKNAYSLRLIGSFVWYGRWRRYYGNICVTVQWRSCVTIVARRHSLLRRWRMKVIRCQALHRSSGKKLN